jgi:hypothetical protein
MLCSLGVPETTHIVLLLCFRRDCLDREFVSGDVLWVALRMIV